MKVSKPMLALDFDGVLHGYTSGWQGAERTPDAPVPGALEFVVAATEHFAVVIYSSRARFPEGVSAIKAWLKQHGFPALPVSSEKPPAFLSIDDRAILFTGTWPDPQELLQFRPWYAGETEAGILIPKAWARDWDAEERRERERLDQEKKWTKEQARATLESSIISGLSKRAHLTGASIEDACIQCPDVIDAIFHSSVRWSVRAYLEYLLEEEVT